MAAGGVPIVYRSGSGNAITNYDFLDVATENQSDLTTTFKNVHELFLNGDNKSDTDAQETLNNLSNLY